MSDNNGASSKALAKKVERKIEKVKSDDFKTLYSNGVELKSSLFDIVLTFEFLEEATEEYARIRELVQIVLSPPHAKKLAAVLSEKVRNYEDRHGSIPMSETTPAAQE